MMKKFTMNEGEMIMQNEEVTANVEHFMMRNHTMNLTLFPCITQSDMNAMMEDSSLQKPQLQLSTQPKFRMG